MICYLPTCIGVKFSFEAKRCSFYNGHDFHTSFELERSFSPSKKLNRGSTSYSNHGWAQFENRLNMLKNISTTYV